MASSVHERPEALASLALSIVITTTRFDLVSLSVRFSLYVPTRKCSGLQHLRLSHECNTSIFSGMVQLNTSYETLCTVSFRCPPVPILPYPCDPKDFCQIQQSFSLVTFSSILLRSDSRFSLFKNRNYLRRQRTLQIHRSHRHRSHHRLTLCSQYQGLHHHPSHHRHQHHHLSTPSVLPEGRTQAGA